VCLGNARRVHYVVSDMAVVILLYLVVEVAAIWAVASLVGALWTIVLLIGGAVAGSWLARREGGKAIRALLDAARSGRSGHQEITDGMLVTLGGLLIFLPGFVTDVLGLLVLLPPTRTVLRKAWLRRMARTGRVRSHRTVVIDGEVVESTEAPRSDKPTGPDDQPRAIEG